MTRERDPHQTALIAAARRLGVEVDDRLPRWGVDVVRYGYGGRSADVLGGCVVAGLTWQTDALIADKAATKVLLAEAGLPVPAGAIWTGDDAAIAPLLAGGPVVVKPIDGTNGEGVAVGLQTAAEVRAHAETLDGVVLVEAFVAGDDLRMHVIGGEVVAACRRDPAAVVGDGTSTVRALAARRDVAVHALNPQNRLVVDPAVLRRQGLDLDAVPAAGARVAVQALANMAVGATAVDVTADLHPRWRDHARRAGAVFGLDVFALDALGDPAADPRDCGACILELNARPQWLHHTFSERATHDIGAMLLRHLLELP